MIFAANEHKNDLGWTEAAGHFYALRSNRKFKNFAGA